MATTWSYGREPPSKDKPEFERHVMGWFDEVTTDNHADGWNMEIFICDQKYFAGKPPPLESSGY